MTKNERLFFNFATHCRNCIVKQAGFKGGFQIRINRPVKSLFPRCCVKALGHICPLCPSCFALPREKIQFYRVRSSFDRVIFLFRQNNKSPAILCVLPEIFVKYGRKRAGQNRFHLI